MIGSSGSFVGFAFGAGTPFPIVAVEGWEDMPAVRSVDVDRPSNHGSFSSRDLLEPRVVTLTLGILGKDVNEYYVLRNQARSAFLSAFTTSELIIDNKLCWAKLRRRAIPDDRSANWRIGEIVLQFYAPDPLLYEPNQMQVSTFLPSSSVGVALPLVFPFNFGAGGTGGTVVAHNFGTVPTSALIQFVGQLTAPKVTHLESGRVLATDIVMEATNTLTLDTDAHSVSLSGGVSRRNNLVTDQWFDLMPGPNTLKFEASSGIASPVMNVFWRSAIV